MFKKKLLFVFLLCVAPSMARGGTINLNDTFNGGAPFVGSTVMFLDAIESNGAPAVPAFNYYQSPLVFGNTLTVNPTNLNVSVPQGPGTSSVTTQLEVIIMSDPGQVITDIEFGESGDFELLGPASFTSQLDFDWTVLAARTPISGMIGGTGGAVHSSSSPPFLSDNWTNGFSIDVSSQIADATKIMLTVTDTLLIEAMVGGGGFGAEKQWSGIGATTQAVPEPAGGLLLLLGLAAMGRIRR